MEIHHFSHDHPLTFAEEQKYDADERVWCCDGCDLPISPGNPSYSCSLHGCKFKLHKVCAELPTEIKKHPLHPNHTLTLLPERYNAHCDACCRDLKKFTYNCESCDFDLNLFCALPSTIGQFPQFKHPSHRHPLTPLLRPALFICTGCHTKHSEGLSYLCTLCDKSWIHQECALLPPTIKRVDLHNDHPLTLAFTIPEKYSTFDIFCFICYDFIEKSSWSYYCGGCRYFAHLTCVIGNKEPFMSILLADWGQGTVYGKKAENIDESEIVCLPVADESSWITNRFSKKTIIKGTKATKRDHIKIYHFSHNDHSLILFNNPNKEESSSEVMHQTKSTTTASTSTSGGRRFCNGCLQTIPKSTPYYGYAPCDYFLHQDCAFLPIELLQHPLHPQHPLVLLHQASRFFGLFQCRCCERWCNGFTYGCNTCKNYYLDLKCASMPTVMTHEAHLSNNSHVFLLRESEDLPLLYKCNSCSFEMDVLYAKLPHTIEHRYDKHSFVLKFRPLKDHPEEYFCELCERELDPQDFFYHCIECDQSIHPICYFNINENLKYGGTINVNCHPHPLAFAKPEWDSECDFCGNFIDIEVNVSNFECVQCVKYRMHYRCAKECVLKN